MDPSEWFIKCKIRQRIILDLSSDMSLSNILNQIQISGMLKRWLKVTRDLVAAKRLKHRRPEDVYFSRKEYHILEAVSGGPGVVKLLDYFESPAQSVIVTEYLEGKDHWGEFSVNYPLYFERSKLSEHRVQYQTIVVKCFIFYSLEK